MAMAGLLVKTLMTMMQTILAPTLSTPMKMGLAIPLIPMMTMTVFWMMRMTSHSTPVKQPIPMRMVPVTMRTLTMMGMAYLMRKMPSHWMRQKVLTWMVMARATMQTPILMVTG